MSTNEFQMIAVSEIRPSGTNPRKHFDGEKLKELAGSIAQSGVLTPLLVRPRACGFAVQHDADNLVYHVVDASGAGVETHAAAMLADERVAELNRPYELVFGERRWRAAMQAGLAEVVCRVRELSDREVLELQLIENLEREDLSPLEEAEGYAHMLELRDEAGARVYSLGSLAERLAKSEVYIRRRLSLRALPTEARRWLDDGRLSASVAELIAMVPGDEARASAAQAILHPDVEVGPLSVVRAREVIRARFMRDLGGAPFDLADGDLVPVQVDESGERVLGGACDGCPFLAGKEREGAHGGKLGNRVCTHPECFELKRRAARSVAERAAEVAGKVILSREDEARVMSDRGLAFNAPFVALDAVPEPDDLVSGAGKVPTWKKLLAGDARPQVYVGFTGHGKPVEMVRRDEAVAAAVLNGHRGIFKGEESAPADRSNPRIGDKDLREEARAQDVQEKARRQKLELEVSRAAMGELMLGMLGRGAVPGFWRALVPVALSYSRAEGCAMVATRMGIEFRASGSGPNAVEAVEGFAADLDDANSMLLVVELLLAPHVKFGGVAYEEFRALLKLYGVDLKKVRKEVERKGAPTAAVKKGKAVAEEAPAVGVLSTETINAAVRGVVVDAAPGVLSGTLEPPTAPKAKRGKRGGVVSPTGSSEGYWERQKDAFRWDGDLCVDPDAFVIDLGDDGSAQVKVAYHAESLLWYSGFFFQVGSGRGSATGEAPALDEAGSGVRELALEAGMERMVDEMRRRKLAAAVVERVRSVVGAYVGAWQKAGAARLSK